MLQIIENQWFEALLFRKLMHTDVMPYNFVYNINEHDIQVSCYRWYDKSGSGGDLTLVGGTEANVKDYVCPDGCVCFRMTVEKTGSENFYKGKFYQEERENGI